MMKIDKGIQQAVAIIVGFLAAIWSGATLFHTWPVPRGSGLSWWGPPWILTVAAISAGAGFSMGWLIYHLLGDRDDY